MSWDFSNNFAKILFQCLKEEKLEENLEEGNLLNYIVGYYF